MGRKINLGVVGLGQRGAELVKNVYSEHPDVEFIALCDVYEDRREDIAKALEEMGRERPKCFSDYREMLEMKELDAVLISASWDTHSEIAIAAMRAGKAVASEVGGAYSVAECWRLVDCYEETKTPIMFMENCVYGRDEMMVYHMAETGVLGEIVHCEGGYKHDLREEIAFGRENRHYRLDNYIHRNSENYPTHELGPIAKILHINRGNRMLSLCSMASKAAGLRDYIQEKKPEDKVLQNTVFQQGDIVNTMIHCSNGESILLTLDTTLPRAYSRGFTVQGTKGMYMEDNASIFLDGDEGAKDHFDWK